MAKSWDDIKERALSPDAKARVDARVKKTLESMALAELRKLAGMTQAEVADALAVKQPTVSKLESQTDMTISTLRRIIEAIGGEIEITARMPQGRFKVAPFSRHSSLLSDTQFSLSSDQQRRCSDTSRQAIAWYWERMQECLEKLFRDENLDKKDRLYRLQLLLGDRDLFADAVANPSEEKEGGPE